jgi:hypothetical protein
MRHWHVRYLDSKTIVQHIIVSSGFQFFTKSSSGVSQMTQNSQSDTREKGVGKGGGGEASHYVCPPHFYAVTYLKILIWINIAKLCVKKCLTFDFKFNIIFCSIIKQHMLLKFLLYRLIHRYILLSNFLPTFMLNTVENHFLEFKFNLQALFLESFPF